MNFLRENQAGVLARGSWIGFLPWAFPAFADEIHLHNGDRLTGEISRMEKEAPDLKTLYARELNVKWQQVLLYHFRKGTHFSAEKQRDSKRPSYTPKQGQDKNYERTRRRISGIIPGRTGGHQLIPPSIWYGVCKL